MKQLTDNEVIAAEWVDLIGAPGYQINERGDVRSNRKYRNWLILKPQKHKKGYLRVPIFVEGQSKMTFVHRLVAATFIPNPNSKPTVNHKNGIKTDNRAKNLEWATYSENMRHANMYLPISGNLLTPDNVIQIRRLVASGVTTKEIAKQFSVSTHTIHDIRIGKNWSYVLNPDKP